MKDFIDFLLKLKEIADDIHYYNDAEMNCETISKMIEEKIKEIK